MLPDALRWSVLTVGPPIGGPILAGTTIIVPLQSGQIAAHQLSDGAHKWTKDQEVEKPLAADSERVYIAAGEAIQAFDAATGAVQWRAPLGGAPAAPPVAHAGWIIAAAASQLIAIRAADGQEIWRQQIGPVEFRPALDGELLLVSVVEGHVTALNVQTGEIRWTCDLGSAPSEPFAAGDRIYVGTQDKYFHTISVESGRVLSSQFVGARVVGRAAVDERHVYFAALDNVLWAIDRGNGAIEWRGGLKYRPAAGPVVLGDRVIVPGRIDTVPVFDARTGSPAGQIAFPARLVQLPLVSAAGDGEPFAIGVTGSLENKWMLSLYSPLSIPPIVVLPLTELPGEVMPPPGR